MNLQLVNRSFAVRIGALALMSLVACSTLSDKELERAETHMQLAHLKYSRGDVRYAIREYTAALEINERNAEAHLGIGEALRVLGQLDEARRHLERALEIEPDHQDARLALSAVHLAAGRWEDAITETTRLIKDPTFLNPARAYLNRGWAQYKLGRLELAETDLRTARSTDSSSFQVHLNLGIVLYERGKTDEAMQSLQRVVGLLEPYHNPSYACAEAEARFRLAQAYVKRSDRASALQHLELAETTRPPCPWGDQAREYLLTLR